MKEIDKEELKIIYNRVKIIIIVCILTKDNRKKFTMKL